MTEVIRVGTWNIREGVPVNGDLTPGHAELIEMLRRNQLDILALQEVPFESANHSVLLEEIMSQTSLRHVSGFSLSPSVFSPNRRAGVAVASRKPHVVTGRSLLPNPFLISDRSGKRWTSWDKGMIAVRLEAIGLRLRVVCLHSYPFHEFGRRADDKEFAGIWRALAKAIDSPADGVIVIAGDFNTERRDLVTEFVDSCTLVSTIGGIATHDGRSMDDIVHDARLTSRNLVVLPSSSDHSFCKVELASLGTR